MKWEWKLDDEAWADARQLERETWWTGAAVTAMQYLLDSEGHQEGDVVTIDLRLTRALGETEARRVKMTLGWSMEWTGAVPATDEEVRECK